MKTREELRAWNQQFWAEFKTYISKTRSAAGRRINWLSYPTEIKDVYLRLKTDKNHVAVVLDFQFRDPGVRAVFWEQMGELRNVLEASMGTEGQWIEQCSSPEVPDFSRIQWVKPGLNYQQQGDWPEIFAFFQERLVAFDAFYQEFKDILLFLAD